jgi:Recombinase
LKLESGSIEHARQDRRIWKRLQEIKAGKQRKRLAEKGWSEGRKPFGTHPTKYKSEAKTLAHIKDLRAKGMNYEQLARELNTSGSKTRSGGKWFPATIRRILTKQ